MNLKNLLLASLLFTSHAAAQLAITSLSPTADAKRILLAWNTTTNFSYRLEASANLVNWRTLFKSDLAGGRLQLVDHLPRNCGAQFYRLTVSTNPPPKAGTTVPSFGYSGEAKPGQPSFGYP